MTYKDCIALLSPIIAMLGVVATTWFAIHAIHRTAQENRISNIHAQLLNSLVETISVVDRILKLLNEIASGVTYYTLPEEKVTETAYDRYWREIRALSRCFKPLRAKHKLLFPKSLYEALRQTVTKLNEAREEVCFLKPDDNHVYPDTSALRSLVDQSIKTHHHFIHECRKYIGTGKLAPINLVDDLSIRAEVPEETRETS